MKKITAIIAAILSLIFLMAPLSYAAELCATDNGEAKGYENPLDFSFEYSSAAYLSPSELLSAIMGDGTELCDAEKEYLDGYFEHFLTYSYILPEALISVSNNSVSTVVTADVAEYDASNGKKIIYTPAYVTVDGDRYEFTAEDGKYVSLLPLSDASSVKVYYNGALPISKDIANRLLNFVFDEATAAMESADYLAEYNKALREYEIYVEASAKYESDLKEYVSYVEAKEIYDKALALYEQNLKDMEAYVKKLDEYNAYVEAYNKYSVELEVFVSEYQKYGERQEAHRAYVENLVRIRTSMVAIESLFIDPPNTRNLYEALQNEELLKMFEKYSSILVNRFGVKDSDIKYMRKYSDELNALLREYAAKREISEKDAFEFYKANYERISFLFNGLYSKMSLILTPTIYNLICGKLELEYGKELGEYKKWRVKNVLSHIYLICLCLDDTKAADSTWQFYSNDGDPHIYYFSDLLSKELIITDTGMSDPSALSWSEDVEVGDAPVMPTRPTEVKKPMEPLELSKPTAPDKVDEPIEPTKVEEPNMPDTFDNDLILRTKGITGLIGDKDSPLLRREEFDGDPVCNVTASAVKSLSEDGKKISVRNYDGEIAARLSSLDELPDAAPDHMDTHFVYTFYNWSLSPVDYIPLTSAAGEELSVYPLYVSSPREYRVTFIFDKTEVTRSFDFGSVPDYTGIDISKDSDARYDYSFNGFDKAVRRVSSDVTYTAIYTESDRIFTVSFNVGNKTTSQKISYGSLIDELPTPPRYYISNTYLYEFTGQWDKAPIAVTEDTVYTAIFKKTTLASAECDDLTVIENASGYTLLGSGDSFELSALLKQAQKSQQDITVRFEAADVEIDLGVSAINSLVAADARYITLLSDNEKGFGFAFTDEDGKLLSPSGKIRLCMPHEFDTDDGVGILANYKSGHTSENLPVSTKDGYVELVPTSGSFYVGAYYKPIRRIRMDIATHENGSVYADETIFREGETVKLHIYPASGYACSDVSLKNTKSGETVSLGAVSEITIPDHDFSLNITFSPIEYTVTFLYGDETYTEKYKFGETPVSPDIPMSFIKDGYFYTFIGWSSPITMVTGEMTYTAKYYSVLESERSIDDSSALTTIIIRYLLPAASVVLVTVGGVILLIVLYKKGVIFKKKKGNDGNGSKI